MKGVLIYGIYRTDYRNLRIENHLTQQELAFIGNRRCFSKRLQTIYKYEKGIVVNPKSQSDVVNHYWHLP